MEEDAGPALAHSCEQSRTADAKGGPVMMSPSEEARRVIAEEEAFWPAIPAEGATCYAVDYRWWRAFCDHTGLDQKKKGASVREFEDEAARPPRPGPLDNSRLAGDPPSEGLREGDDFTFKSPGTWQLFQERYPGSGPAVPRLAPADGRASLYFYTFKAHRSSALTEEPRAVRVPKNATFGDLKRGACEAWGLQPGEVRLWDYYQLQRYGKAPVEAKLGEALDSPANNMLDQQDVLLEEKVDGSFPDLEDSSADSAMDASPFAPLRLPFSTAAEDVVTPAEGAAPGTAGLANLGNTCFMNSSVQCLAHSAPLVRVFLSGRFEADLNRDNPLGNKGLLAEAFGELVRKLWQAGVRSVSPRRFKQQLASFAPHFAGYQQHDSQELLSFLLDGLHEDLNRVRRKPYIEEPDSDGRPDEELAAEAWRNFKARNDSFVVDHFQGMYKSRLVCPDCGFESVKMDTFNCLSLPLPAAKMRSVEVTVVAMDGSQPPTQFAVEVLKLGTIGDLYAALARVCGLPAGEDPAGLLLLVQVRDGKVHRKFTDARETLADAFRPEQRVQLLAYRYPSAQAGPGSGGKELHVFQRRPAQKRSFFYSSGPSHEVFAAPLLLWVPEGDIRATAGEAAQPEALLGADGPLGRAVETALRPFKKQRTVVEAPSHQEAGPQPPSQEQPAAPLAEGLPALQPPSASPATEQPEPVVPQPAAEQQPEAAEAPAPSAGAALHGSGALSISPRETPAASPVTSSTGSPRAGSGESSGFHAAVPEVQPFDMFPVHQMDTAEAQPAADVAADGGPPYRIQPAAPDGGPPAVGSGGPSLEDGELYFAIDWAADAGSHYEPERIERPRRHESVAEADRRRAAPPTPFSLDECVEAFLEGERLEDSESWYCKRCKQLVQAHKKLDLWSLPEVLVVHLKRFSYSHRFRDKIDTLVRFPLAGWDLAGASLRAQDVPPVYDLYAVSNHYGGLGGGHYTAACLVGDRWRCFDDSHTYEIAPDRVMSEAAYVLFYRRRAEAERDAAAAGEARSGGQSDMDTASEPAATLVSLASDVATPGQEAAQGNGHAPVMPAGAGVWEMDLDDLT